MLLKLRAHGIGDGTINWIQKWLLICSGFESKTPVMGNETSRLTADISTMLGILLTGKQQHCIIRYVTGH